MHRLLNQTARGCRHSTHDASRLEFQRRAGGDAGAGAAAGAGRTARLARQRHVRDGDEPSRQPFHVDPRQGRSRPARRSSTFRRTIASCSCKAAHWRKTPQCRSTCCRPTASPITSTPGHWAQKSIAEARKYGRVNVAASSADANYTYIPPQSAWKLSRTRELRARHDQRDDRRCRIFPDSGHRCRPARGGCVVAHPVAAVRRREVRRDLRRRAEEHRPGRVDGRHRARRPHGPRAPRMPERLRLRRRRRKRIRCSIRRRRSRSTSPA